MTMRLSDAIRLGAMLRPQAYGHFFSLTHDSRLGSCALGAAAEATGLAANTKSSAAGHRQRQQHVRRLWPDLWKASSYPACGIGGAANAWSTILLAEIVEHLNDSHLWTRERIADWLDTRESAPETTVAAADAVVV